MNGVSIGRTSKGQDIFYPDTTPCLTAISGSYSYLCWEGDLDAEQWIVRLYNTATLLKVEKALGKWADRATLAYQYI